MRIISMKKLIPLLFLLALPCCDFEKLPPRIPLGTEVTMKDGKTGWICGDRTWNDGCFKYRVKFPIWGGYQEILAGDFEFTVKTPTLEKRD
jgi:hypothetical protein